MESKSQESVQPAKTEDQPSGVVLDKATLVDSGTTIADKAAQRRAAERVLESNGDEPHYRLCWECDPLKVYLKLYPFVIQCPSCSKVFYKGSEVQLETIEDP